MQPEVLGAEETILPLTMWARMDEAPKVHSARPFAAPAPRAGGGRRAETSPGASRSRQGKRRRRARMPELNGLKGLLAPAKGVFFLRPGGEEGSKGKPPRQKSSNIS